MVDAVTRTVVEDYACQNAGDYQRVAALYTDAGLAEDYTWFTEEDLEWFTAPPEVRDEADWNIVNSVSQVDLLPDGRVGARVEFGDQGKYGSDYLIFAEQDGRYLIDHWVDELLVTAAGEPDGMQLVSIGDRSLAMLCQGEGSPTVILEAGGLGTPSIVWADVMVELAKQTRVCRYERANNWSGLSDPAPMPRTGADVVADLHALLEASGETGPYVLVGPSFGGIFVRLYEATYPDDVAGMVLVDATHEDMNTLQGVLLSPEDLQTSIELDAEQGDPEEIWTIDNLDNTFQQMRDARAKSPMQNIPLIVLAAGDFTPDPDSPYPPEADALWPSLAAALQIDLAHLTPDARLIVVPDSGHFIHQAKPEVAISAIMAVVNAVRDPTTWGPAATPVAEPEATPVS
ncbi:MAG: alpha/beta hydrolase [Thermomicrobiales bacterium]